MQNQLLLSMYKMMTSLHQKMKEKFQYYEQ